MMTQVIHEIRDFKLLCEFFFFHFSSQRHAAAVEIVNSKVPDHQVLICLLNGSQIKRKPYENRGLKFSQKTIVKRAKCI